MQRLLTPEEVAAKTHLCAAAYDVADLMEVWDGDRG
jgi:hypothetical protein